MSTGDAEDLGAELWVIISEELTRHQENNRLMQALFSGDLQRERLEPWARQLYFLTRTGTRFISAIHSNCDNFEVSAWLVQNLYEEYGEMRVGRDHTSLCRNFVLALGANEEELESEVIPECTRAFIAYTFELTRQRHFVEALAGFGIALEGVSARVTPMVGAALRQHYGLSEDATAFFNAHSEMDVEHSNRTLELIKTHADTPELRARVKATVRDMSRRILEWSTAVSELCLAEPIAKGVPIS